MSRGEGIMLDAECSQMKTNALCFALFFSARGINPFMVAFWKTIKFINLSYIQYLCICVPNNLWEITQTKAFLFAFSRQTQNSFDLSHKAKTFEKLSSLEMLQNYSLASQSSSVTSNFCRYRLQKALSNV